MIGKLPLQKSWMEWHPLPFVSTTNLIERMDAAVPRRFTFKLRFEALDPVRAALASGACSASAEVIAEWTDAG